MKRNIIFRTIILSLISFLSVLSLSSCKVEVVNKEQRKAKTFNVPVNSFDRIYIAYPADIVYIPSDTFSIMVKAPEKAGKDLDIGVRNGTLEIKKSDLWKDDHYIVFHSHYDDATITVKAPTLKYVAIAGSADFNCDTTITTQRLDLEIAGSGYINVKDIQAQTVSASIAGSGNIDAGLTRVNNTNLSLAGSGDIDIKFSQCGDVKTSIAGSGDIKLSGDVRSYHQDVSGSGDMHIDKLRIGK